MKRIACYILLMLLVTPTYAYDLNSPACTSTAGYEPIYGKCNSAGKLQGTGATLIKSMVIRGHFEAGLPSGSVEYGFSSQSDTTSIKSLRTSDVDNWGAYLALAARSEKLIMSYVQAGWLVSALNKIRFCGITIENNVISQSKFQCYHFSESGLADMAGRPINNELAYSITPLTSKGYINANGSIEIDASEVSMNRRAQSYAGTAEVVLIDQNKFVVNGFRGKISGASASSLTGRKDASDEMVGYFDVVCGWQSCSISQRTAKLEGQKINADYLTTKTLFGRTYQYVSIQPRSNNNYRSDFVYYFKSPDGLTFDASVISSPDQCKYRGHIRTPGARLITKYADDGKSKILDIIPECGMVTMPNGKSFTGAFDSEGRPATD